MKKRVILSTAVVVLFCGCRALGFDHGPCIFCKQPDPEPEPYVWQTPPWIFPPDMPPLPDKK